MNPIEGIDMTHANAELFAALASAQAKLENANRNAKNSHFGNEYADLGTILAACRPVLAEAGICITQAPSYDGTACHVTTVLAHSAGGWVSGTISCIPAKCDGQGVGAATTYLRRYGLAAMVAIGQQDDDGQAARHDRRPDPLPARNSPARKATPPAGPTRAEMIQGLRVAYHDAGVTSGDIAAEIMRKAGMLPAGVSVPDLDAARLRRAYDARATLFADASDDVVILNADEPPA